MKILFVSPYAPNLIRVRPYQIIRALTRAGHQVTLATLWHSAAEQADLQTLCAQGVDVLACELSTGRTVWNSLLAAPSTMPIQANFCWQPALARRLTQVMQSTQFDAIHIEHLRGARYGLHVQSVLNQLQVGRRPPVVWDSVDCITHLFRQAAQQSRSRQGRLITALELGRTQRYEGWLVHQFDQVLATSANDAQALEELASSIQKRGQRVVQVLPNGVDLDYFRPAAGGVGEPELPTQPRQPTLVFSGKMSYHANVTAALHLVQDIMPLVWAQRPEVQVQLVGKDPPLALRKLAQLPAGPDGASRVVVTGTVPDLRPYLQQADLAVAPVPYGAGIQNKVLEAMACATPVVASAQAASGLRASARGALVVAEDVPQFAQAILALLANAPDRIQLGRMGLQYVERWHSWDAVGAFLAALYG